MHVHSHFSMDSGMDLDDICRRAIELGLKGVCVTDHVEHQKADIGYGKYDAAGYFEELDRARQRYSDRLLILSGIEFSEPHLYPGAFERYARLPYDSIIGSVHYWIGPEAVEDMVENRPIEDAFLLYWQALKETVALGCFTVLGHVDFPRRFYRDRVYTEEALSEIFTLALRGGIVPEINTSPLRIGAGGTMPDGPLLELYRRCGGRRVVLGSDAHAPEHIGADLSAAAQEAAAKEMAVGYFEKRRFRPLRPGER